MREKLFQTPAEREGELSQEEREPQQELASSLRIDPKQDLSRQVIPLNVQHQLVLCKTDDGQIVSIQKTEGESLFRIHLSEGDVHIEMSGNRIVLEAKHQLEISAEDLCLTGRKSLHLISGHDLKLKAAHDAEFQAQEHRISAERGSVRVKSTDDIALNGERILLNS